MQATALDYSELPKPTEVCTRCGTFAELSPFWGRRLCMACAERETRALRGGGVSVGGLLSGLGSFPLRVWLTGAALQCAAGIPSLVRTLAGDSSLRGLSYDIMLYSVASALITYVGVEAMFGRKASVRAAANAFVRRFGAWFGASFLGGLWVVGMSLLFVVPGVLKALSLALITPIILFEALVPAKEVLKTSARRMHGARLSAFVVYILFFGLQMLVAVLAGALVAASTTLGGHVFVACAELLSVALGSPATLVTTLLYVRLTPPDSAALTLADRAA
jgi:hypothetical protein